MQNSDGSQTTTSSFRPFAQSWRDMMPFFVHYFIFGFAWSVYFLFSAMWLLERGISPVVIGSFFLFSGLLRLVFTPVLTELCDKIGDRWAVVLGVYITFIPIGALMMNTEISTFTLSIVTCVCMGILGSILTILESYTMVCSRIMHFHYTTVRAFLSVAVTLGCLFLGVFYQTYGIDILPHTGLVLLVLLLLSTLTLPRFKSERSVMKVSLLEPLKIPYFVVVIVISLLAFMSFSSIMATGNLFFVESRGFSTEHYSRILSIAVFAEAVMLFWVAKRVHQWSIFATFAIASVGTIVRFLGYYYGHSLISMMAAHALHALSYGLVHAMVMEFIRRNVPDKYISSAQGLYDMAAYFGYGLGTIMGGYMFEHYGENGLLFASMITAGVVVVIASGCYMKRHGLLGRLRI